MTKIEYIPPGHDPTLDDYDTPGTGCGPIVMLIMFVLSCVMFGASGYMFVSARTAPALPTVAKMPTDTRTPEVTPTRKHIDDKKSTATVTGSFTPSATLTGTVPTQTPTATATATKRATTIPTRRPVSSGARSVGQPAAPAINSAPFLSKGTTAVPPVPAPPATGIVIAISAASATPTRTITPLPPTNTRTSTIVPTIVITLQPPAFTVAPPTTNTPMPTEIPPTIAPPTIAPTIPPTATSTYTDTPTDMPTITSTPTATWTLTPVQIGTAS